MSTYEKGNLFEDKVYREIERLVREGELRVTPSSRKVRRKARYFSQGRQAYIVFDVSIEVQLRGAERLFMLLVVECKDLSQAVSVDDVEEFKAKLDQVAGKNVKGLFAVTGSLQKGALNYAHSQGIAQYVCCRKNKRSGSCTT